MRHNDDCNVWVGCQQCDGPDLTRKCTCLQHQEIDHQIWTLQMMKKQINQLDKIV